MSKTEDHRKIYPLRFEEISRLSSFEQIFGKTKAEYSYHKKIKRWNKAMSFGSEDLKSSYMNINECLGCSSLNNGWCDFSELPCGINPIITFQLNIIGMACKGLNYKKNEQTTKLVRSKQTTKS